MVIFQVTLQGHSINYDHHAIDTNEDMQISGIEQGQTQQIEQGQTDRAADMHTGVKPFSSEKIVSSHKNLTRHLSLMLHKNQPQVD